MRKECLGSERLIFLQVVGGGVASRTNFEMLPYGVLSKKVANFGVSLFHVVSR